MGAPPCECRDEDSQTLLLASPTQLMISLVHMMYHMMHGYDT